MSYKIRRACRDDCANIISLIQELADFENFPSGPKLTVDDLIRDGFGAHPSFYCFVAEYVNEAEKGKQDDIVGFAFFYNIYGTWSRKSFYLEDICVTQKHRKKGVGSALWDAIVQEVVKNDYRKLHFFVLNWNTEAINFYKKRGAEDKTLSDSWTCHRLTREDMEKSAKLNMNKSSTLSYKIRAAASSDCSTILSMIKEFAKSDSEEYVNRIITTEDDLKRDGFGEHPAFHVLLAEYWDETTKAETPEIIGYLFYYYTYSTWGGKAAYLEEFYVKEKYRYKGIGTALWNALIQAALQNNCCRIDFTAIPKAFQFYEKKGAKNMAKCEGWHFFWVTTDNIKRHLANKLENN